MYVLFGIRFERFAWKDIDYLNCSGDRESSSIWIVWTNLESVIRRLLLWSHLQLLPILKVVIFLVNSRFHNSKDGNISKNTAHWAVLRIIAEMGALYHFTLCLSNVPSWFGFIMGHYVFNITFYVHNHRPAGWVLHVEGQGCMRWSSTQVRVAQDQHPVGQNFGTWPLGLAQAALEFLSLREDFHHAMRVLDK